jgi:ATP-binding cassette subfamily B protein
MYDVTEGQILFDDVDIKNLNISNFRNQMAYVPQDVFLFSETIKNNIKFGINGISEDKIYDSAKKAVIFDNIMDFEDGFETKIGERGITLSGGQKQRISIARAIIRNPKILVLDDCLSAVDTNTENAILNNLKGIMNQKTTFLISHRVSNARLADKIIVLDDGKIVELGTHKQLLETGGMYKDLYEKQSCTEAVVL